MTMAAPKIDLRKVEKCYGTYTAFAKRLGLSLSTVHGWKLRDNIPAWRIAQITTAANEDGHDIFKKRRNKKSVQ